MNRQMPLDEELRWSYRGLRYTDAGEGYAKPHNGDTRIYFSCGHEWRLPMAVILDNEQYSNAKAYARESVCRQCTRRK